MWLTAKINYWGLFLALLCFSASLFAASKTPKNLPPQWATFPTGLSWHWQLQGKIHLKRTVDVIDIDLFDRSRVDVSLFKLRGMRVVCYFSAGSWESYRNDAQAISELSLGNRLDGWPDERWLDIRQGDVKAMMLTRLQRAAKNRCDAVEPDNIDVYTQDSGFNISFDEQIVYNRWLADQAHRLGLAVALKNNLEQAIQLEPYFDFAIVEQCFEYAECAKTQVFHQANKAVFVVEYPKFISNQYTLPNKHCSYARQHGIFLAAMSLNLDAQGAVWCE